jgi:ABC-type Na+ efflux pump permease subunit
MNSRAMDFAADVISMGWLTGPIFEKELRVTSRRVRYYLLRASYVLLLCLMLTYMWLATTATDDSSVHVVLRTMQMSAIARGTCSAIIWFQFITLQLLAMVMLGNSISDEIRKRTLDALASTPVTSLQIVVGKLSSRLLQLLLLLGVSFPFLAIIRSFGGVPWDFIVAGLAITLTTTILVGSVTVLVSIANRHAYRSILSAFCIMLFLYVVPPLLEGLLRQVGGFSSPYLLQFLWYCGFLHPFRALIAVTASMTSAQQTTFNWPVHCLAILGISLIVVAISTASLRRVVILTGSCSSVSSPTSFLQFFSGRARAVRRRQQRPLSTVVGNPIVWKDMLVDHSRWSPTMWRGFVIAALALTYTIAFMFDALSSRVFHGFFAGIVVLIGLLRTATCSASSIAAEKEARAWPILLCTPLANGDILKGKVVGILRRTLPVWVILFAHLTVFMVAGVLDVLNVVAVAVVIVPPVVFLIGTGVYFGLRLKTLTGAFVVTFAPPLVLWFACPCLGFIMNPMVMAGMAAGIPMPMLDVFMGNQGPDMLVPLLFMAVPSALYVGIGLIFAHSAANTIRRSPF